MLHYILLMWADHFYFGDVKHFRESWEWLRESHSLICLFRLMALIRITLHLQSDIASGLILLWLFCVVCFQSIMSKRWLCSCNYLSVHSAVDLHKGMNELKGSWEDFPIKLNSATQNYHYHFIFTFCFFLKYWIALPRQALNLFTYCTSSLSFTLNEAHFWYWFTVTINDLQHSGYVSTFLCDLAAV